MAGAAADRRWGVVSGRAGRPRAAGAGSSAGGGWRLRGVEFDDKLEALDFRIQRLENLMTGDEKVRRLTCSLTPHARKTRTHVGVQH